MQYVRKHPWGSLFVFITSIIEPILYMIPIFISANIVGILVEGGGWNDIWGAYKLLIVLATIQVLLFFASSFLNEVLAHRITTDMTYDLFATLQSRSLTYHDTKDTGDIMARATNDTRSVNMGLSPGVRMLLATVAIWVVSGAILYTVNPYLTIVMLFIFIVFTIMTLQYGLRIAPLSNQVLEELAIISSTTSDTLTGIRDIKTYTAQQIFKRNFAKQTFKQAASKEREGILGAWFYPDLMVRLFVLSMVGYGLFLTYQGSMSFENLVLLTLAMALTGSMAEEMNWIAFVSVGAFAAIERLNLFMTEPDPHDFEDGTLIFENLPASIEFENVTFSYPNTKTPALDGVSFLIEDSQTLAIVGSPGSGKSTITKLIQRLYIPQTGEIRVGNNPITTYTNQSLRENIATVEQDVFLFNDTVKENIAFGKPDTPIEEIIDVANIAQSHKFIEQFENGYETIIGEDGVRLSGGQAQRIAIARAILMNPEILIFDDGASALDSKTEVEIQNAISEILRTRTTIITTHRLAIIAKADKILILEKGKKVGFGSHEELIQGNIFYRNLFEKHFELPPLFLGGD
ncbi:MAG: ABC transporter ATP-binding protein [Candidatus Heimdallarchaeota archaeon]